MSAPTTTLAAEGARFTLTDWGLLAFAAGVWGASFLFMAIGLDAFEPGLVTFLRVGFGAATVWAIPLHRRHVERDDWLQVTLLGVTWMAFPLTMFPIAQQWIDSSLAGMLNSAMPIATVAVTTLVFAVPTVRIRLIGVGVGLVGIVMIGVPEATTAGTTALGILLVLLAVISYGFAVNIAGPLQRSYGALPVIRRALLVATVLTLPYGIIDGARSSFAWDSLAACIALGAAGTGAAFVAASILTGRVGAVRTSIVTYLIPIVSTVLGVVFRDETVTFLAISGTVIVLAGAWLTTLGQTPAIESRPIDRVSVGRRRPGRDRRS
ncbi:MAG: DMT family transporter [Acidimicrobiia bacterium]|nr:DMT family transporter [Acidimicrobiia bacterium]